MYKQQKYMGSNAGKIEKMGESVFTAWCVKCNKRTAKEVEMKIGLNLKSKLQWRE
jgi:hypothetical protein